MQDRQHGPRRVCYIVASNEGCGWAVDQLRILRDEHGWDVTCIVAAPAGPLQERLRAEGIPFHTYAFDPHMLPSSWSLVRHALQLSAILRRERIDVVQTMLWHSMLIGRLAAWLANVPVRLSMVVGPFHLDAPISRWVDRATCWMDTTLIGTCQNIVDIYRSLGVTDDRLALVYLGPHAPDFDPETAEPYDLREEYGWPSNTPVIAHVAWFYQRVPANGWIPPTCHGQGFKGHEELIRATPHILGEFPHARIVLVGGGWHETGAAFMAEMQALVEQLGLQDRVIFAGPRSNIAGIYQKVDIAVQPSLTESCGGTRESLLMSRPTVATRVGGMPDMVIDGVTGVLVNPADPEDLARGICDLLRNPERGRALARAGREHVLRVSTLEKTGADLDALYRRGLETEEAPPPWYRPPSPLLRVPVIFGIGTYLSWRVYAIEYSLRPRWARGWRPWQPRALFLLPLDLAMMPVVALAPRSVMSHAYRLGVTAREWIRARFARHSPPRAMQIHEADQNLTGGMLRP